MVPLWSSWGREFLGARASALSLPSLRSWLAQTWEPQRIRKGFPWAQKFMNKGSLGFKNAEIMEFWGFGPSHNKTILDQNEAE